MDNNRRRTTVQKNLQVTDEIYNQEGDLINFYQDSLDDTSYDAKMINEMFDMKRIHISSRGERVTIKIKNADSEGDETYDNSGFSLHHNNESQLNSDDESLSDARASLMRQTRPKSKNYQGRQGKTNGKDHYDNKVSPETSAVRVKKTLGYKIQSNLLKSLNLKEKVKTHTMLNFFKPPKTSNVKPSKKKGGIFYNKITKKLTGGYNLKVKADDSRYDELGKVTFYGNIPKRIRETNKYHSRWLFLRGFDF